MVTSKSHSQLRFFSLFCELILQKEQVEWTAFHLCLEYFSYFNLTTKMKKVQLLRKFKFSWIDSRLKEFLMSSGLVFLLLFVLFWGFFSKEIKVSQNILNPVKRRFKADPGPVGALQRVQQLLSPRTSFQCQRADRPRGWRRRRRRPSRTVQPERSGRSRARAARCSTRVAVTGRRSRVSSCPGWSRSTWRRATCPDPAAASWPPRSTCRRPRSRWPSGHFIKM